MGYRTDQVMAIFEYALSMPDAEPRRRLRSERDLAAALQVGRRQVNEALVELARRGVLARERGSGTYIIRRVSLSESQLAAAREAWEAGPVRDVEAIFLPVMAPAPTPTVSQHALRLCLCGDWLNSSPVHQLIVQRMIDAVQQRGHLLTIISVLGARDKPLTPEQLQVRLRAETADGYLVVDRWGHLFLRALGEQAHPPVIFCGQTCGFRHEPAVGVCNVDLIPRVLRHFGDQGYSRIAMLGYHSAASPIELQQDAYERAADGLGMTYRRCHFVPLGDMRPSTSVRQLLAAGPDRPEAIYLADEFLAPALLEAAESMGIVFGRDMGLICLTNRGLGHLPQEWSRFEIDIKLAGELAVEMLLRAIHRGDELPSNLLLHPRWLPRQTHQRPGQESAVDRSIPLESEKAI